MPRHASSALAAVGCAVALAGGCGGEEPLAPSAIGRAVPTATSQMQPVQFAGTVLDWSSGAAAAHVTVELGGVRAVTDATGRYTMTLPAAGPYDPIVAGQSCGVSHVSGPSYRGDFLANSGTCVSRYGVVANARTGLPIAGAAVSLSSSTATTDATGWYRIDLGCPGNGQSGFNTTFMTVTKDGFVGYRQVVGPGVYLSIRMDIELLPDGGD